MNDVNSMTGDVAPLASPADRKIAVIGLGYVGLPLAVEFGKRRPVVGFDIDAARIAELRAGTDRTLEVDASELREARHLTYTTDIGDIADCDTYIVTVPTPIDAQKRPDLRPLIAASIWADVAPAAWPASPSDARGQHRVLTAR